MEMYAELKHYTVVIPYHNTGEKKGSMKKNGVATPSNSHHYGLCTNTNMY